MDEKLVRSILAASINSIPDLPCVSPIDQPCSEKVINSHSIQKAKALKKISVNGHVKMISSDLSFDTPPETKAEDEGINKATTFRALCSKHDKSIFIPIDDFPLDAPSEEQLFLLAYRSFLMGYYSKKCQIHNGKTGLELLKKNSMIPPEFIKQKTSMIEAELKDYEDLKIMFDATLQNKKYSKEFEFILNRTFELPFCVSSFLSPKFSWAGLKIYNPFDINQPAPKITIDALPVTNGSLVSLCIPKIFEQTVKSVIEPFRYKPNEMETARLTWELTLRYCENVAINPTFWNNIPSANQIKIEGFFQITTGYDWVPFPIECAIFK